jgi:streptogramin lyase
VLVVLIVVVPVRPAEARQVLFVNDLSANAVGQYNAVTGATMNAAFVSGQGGRPQCVAVDGNNHLFVGYYNNVVVKYDATTASILGYINGYNNGGQGLQEPLSIATDFGNSLFIGQVVPLVPSILRLGWVGKYDIGTGNSITDRLLETTSYTFEVRYTALAVDRNNNLFAALNLSGVGKYDATTGVGNRFFVESGQPTGLAVDALNHLFVADHYDNTIGEYDATTGAAIHVPFISGLNQPGGLTLDGNNHLFVVNSGNGTVSEYDATTGGTINATFISGLGFPTSIAFLAPVPEPSSLLLVATAAAAGIYRYRRARRR